MTRLSIVTAVSRPENLPRIHKSIEDSIEGCGLEVHWIMVFGTPRDVDEEGVARLFLNPGKTVLHKCIDPDGPSSFGVTHRNMAISFIEDGFYYCLDDDNIVHPNFLRRISQAIRENPTKRAFAFNQQRWDGRGILRAAPEFMTIFNIDNAMFAAHRSLIGDDRYEVKYASVEDFYFYRKLYDKDSDTFVFIDEILSYHNFLRYCPVK